MNKFSNALKLNKLLKTGLLLYQSNKLSEAKSIYKEALNLSPLHPEILTNLGTIDLLMGNTIEGVGYIEKSIKLQPMQPKAIVNLANGLLELNKLNEAIKLYDASIKFNKNHAEAYHNRGIALKGLKKFDESIQSYKDAIAIIPNYYSAILNLGFLFNLIGKYELAIAEYSKAISVNSENIEAYYNRGISYDNLKLFDLALNDYDYLIKKYGHINSKFNKACLYLLLHRYQSAWDLYDSRWKTTKYINSYIVSSKPILENFSIQNKNIFIWAEQGIGDQILFGSMLSELSNSKNNFIVSIDDRLIPLFKRSFPWINFVSSKNTLDENLYDFHLPIGDLGKFFRIKLSDFDKQNSSYLKSDTNKTSQLKNTIEVKNKLVCGLSWKSKNPDFGDAKSITLEMLLPIITLPNIQFINLQYGETDEEIKNIFDCHNINIKNIESIDNYNDIDGLASLVDACDLVITTSNVTAHIAGALNKRTHLLVPFTHGKIWYWHENGDRSLWYSSIEIHRQTELYNWDKPINDIAKVIYEK